MADAQKIRFNDGTMANFKDARARSQIQSIQTQVDNITNTINNIGASSTFEVRTTDPIDPAVGQAWIKKS